MSDGGFELDPRLRSDATSVCELRLCEVLLMNDAAWPWLVLVPRRAGMRELIDLSLSDQQQLSVEMASASQVLQRLYGPDKLNVAALGNIVEQLHIHVIARYRDDPAWPAPIWGLQAPTPYVPARLEEQLIKLRTAFMALTSTSKSTTKSDQAFER